MVARFLNGAALHVLIGLLIVMAPAAAATADAPGRPAPDPPVDSPVPPEPGELAGQIARESRIRVLGVLPGDTLLLESPRVVGHRLQGSLVGHRDSLVTADFDQIAGLDRRVSSAGRVALMGGVIGGVIGGIAGVSLADFCIFGDCPTPTAGEYIGAGLEGLALGGAIGGVAGALLGAPFHRWSRFYPDSRMPAATSDSGNSATARQEAHPAIGPVLALEPLHDGIGLGIEVPLSH